MLTFDSMEYKKVKSAFKIVVPRGTDLESLILSTMATVANVVGGTLGPGGHPVLIERPEFGLPPMITKDGVTVFRSLGFQNPVAHCIMESARDASVRTAMEAGDGTTTATLLAEAFVRLTYQYCKNHPNESPHRVVQDIQTTFNHILLPEIGQLAIKTDLESDEGRRLLHSVARISANGDNELANAVMECYDICGDDGNVSIIETSGPSRYEVEKIEGFPIPMGYEESCAKFAPIFINDPATQRCLLDKPAFLLYFGKLTEIQSVLPLLSRMQEAWSKNYLSTPNLVIVATGFSESVLASLAKNFPADGSLNIFPLLVPLSPVANGQRHFMDDLVAVTGGTIFDPLTKPLDGVQFEDLGNLALDTDTQKWTPLGVTGFECSRYRATVLGSCNEELLLRRVDEIRSLVEFAESELDATWQRERLAKLTGGIAKLKVIGSSNGELKERRDRAEDAVCAVRGAIKHGCLIGGGWTLIRLAHLLNNTELNREVVRPALLTPVHVLFNNAGIRGSQKIENIVTPLCQSAEHGDIKQAVVWDAQNGKYVGGLDAGILDSVPAVREALRNAISIATLQGTLGAIVVHPRDDQFERSEAHEVSDFNRMSNFDPNEDR